MQKTTDSAQRVFVVDDDPDVRDSLGMLLESVDLPYSLYATAQAFLDDVENVPVGCIVLDIRMPGMSGLELQEELRHRELPLPIIFITGHGDISMAVKAMRLGALDFVTKPYHEQALLDRIHEALAQDASNRQLMYDHYERTKRISSLTPREHQVFERVTDGLANKVIAFDLTVSERTVEVHRAQVMKKLGVRSVAELVRIRLEAERPLHEPVTASADAQ
ncbi:response regulator [Congregibacter variabilis]|uniref:Response regulator n=1 Tax=Congregibacter variabilis TaxID=3081200 RepID=A0ABZ0I3L2_9GAMM|nr:response regulator [Congregibacter sp. IMCC43200]